MKRRERVVAAQREAEAIGEWVQKQIRKRGIGRFELAERAGFEDPNAGAKEIASWAAGRVIIPDDRIVPFCKALSARSRPLRKLIANYDKSRKSEVMAVKSAKKRRQEVVDEELRLLALHYELLMRNAVLIAGVPDYNGVCVDGLVVVHKWVVSHHVPLGVLLHNWKRGLMQLSSINGVQKRFMIVSYRHKWSIGRSVVTGFFFGETDLQTIETGLINRGLAIVDEKTTWPKWRSEKSLAEVIKCLE